MYSRRSRVRRGTDGQKSDLVIELAPSFARWIDTWSTARRLALGCLCARKRYVEGKGEGEQNSE